MPAHAIVNDHQFGINGRVYPNIKVPAKPKISVFLLPNLSQMGPEKKAPIPIAVCPIATINDGIHSFSQTRSNLVTIDFLFHL